MGGVHTEYRDVLSDPITRLRTEVPLEGLSPEPHHAYFAREFQSKSRNWKLEQGKWEVEQSSQREGDR